MTEVENVPELLTEKRRLLVSARKREIKKLSRQEFERDEAE